MMTRWEYLTVQTGFFGLNNNKIGPQFVNGQELKDWKKVSLPQFLNQLGTDGWEMSSTLSVWSGTSTYLFFKRPGS